MLRYIGRISLRKNLLRRGNKYFVSTPFLLYLWYMSLYYLLFVVFSFLSSDVLKRKELAVASVVSAQDAKAHLIALIPLEVWSKNNHDRVASAEIKKDWGNVVI